MYKKNKDGGEQGALHSFFFISKFHYHVSIKPWVVQIFPHWLGFSPLEKALRRAPLIFRHVPSQLLRMMLLIGMKTSLIM